MRVLYETLRTANFLLEQLLLDGNDLLIRRDARWLVQVVGDYFYGRYGKLKVLTAQRMQISDDPATSFGSHGCDDVQLALVRAAIVPSRTRVPLVPAALWRWVERNHQRQPTG
jgi:hypothetical protein